MIEVLLLFLQQETCAECHERTGAEFQASVHAKEIRCTSCHGGNGEVFDEKRAHLPDFKKQPLAACMDCHLEVAEHFGRSPHAAEMRTGNMKGCVECHSAHRVEEPSPRILATACARCHGHEPGILKEAKDFGGSLERLRGASATAREQLDLAAFLESAAKRQHSLELRPLATEARQKEEAAAEFEGRRLWLLPGWGLILLNVGLLVWKLRRLRR